MTVNWEAFDCNKPLSGLFWAVVESVEFDGDLGDDGFMRRGEPTGEVSRHVALVSIQNQPDQSNYYGPEIEPVNCLDTGDFDHQEDDIILIAPFTMPECPVPTKESVEQ